MSFMPEHTEIEKFEEEFFFSKPFTGGKAQSMDEIIDFFNKTYSEIKFRDPQAYSPKHLRNYFHKYVDFQYITATFASGHNRVKLAFKLPDEDFYRMGAPFVEKGTDTVGVGSFEECIKLYESPKKQVTLASQFK